MKKFLSLALALVMTFSLVTISAGAAGFTDKSSITYGEAVDVVSTVGIVDGYSGGDFQPTGVLTRGAAAKIICNMILGPTTAAALSADTAPFSDVPANHVFAGYIAYCQQKGIISGYGNGTFGPANTLSGYAFLKMLLGALGYDAGHEGYTDANWTVNVAKQAMFVGLDNGLTDELIGSKAVTREEACLYVFNALQADLVEYNKSEWTITSGDLTITTNPGNAKAVEWNNSADRNGNIKNDGYIQFAEQYFNKLQKQELNDGFGRPATKWTYKGVKVGTYSDTPDVSYVGSVKINQIYADLNMSTKDTAELYINGKPAGDFYGGSNTVVVQKSNDDKLSATTVSNGKIGNGTIVEVFRDDDTNDVTICAISVYGGKISAVKDATSKKDAYVEVEYDATNKPTTIQLAGNDEFETEDFEEDDVVAYTYSEEDKEIKSMYKLDSVEGSLTVKTMTKSLKLGDKTYTYAKEYGFEGDLTEDGLTNKSDYVVYLDANGYALWIDEAEFAVDAYALVEKISCEGATQASDIDSGLISPSSSIWDGNRAKLLFADGTEKTVTLDKAYVASGTLTIVAGDIVRFKVNDDGEYKLTTLAAANIDNSAANDFGINNKTISGLSATTDADSKSIFVVQNNSQDDFDVYTGIKNAPKVTTGTAYSYIKDDVIKVVFVLGGTVSNASKDVIFVAGQSASKVYKQGDCEDYYVYNAVVKGEVTTIMVDSDTALLDTLTPGEKTEVIWNDTSADSDDIIYSASWTVGDVTRHFANGIKKVSADEIKLGGKTLSVASDVKVFLVDVDGNIEAVSITDIKTNADNDAYYTMEDGEITNLFVVER